MGNLTSRNDSFAVPPGFVPPGYPPSSTITTWNPIKRSQLKKREKAMREYLYTTPLLLQYPNGLTAGTQRSNPL
jgi:hypothetical protein